MSNEPKRKDRVPEVTRKMIKAGLSAFEHVQPDGSFEPAAIGEWTLVEVYRAMHAARPLPARKKIRPATRVAREGNKVKLGEAAPVRWPSK
jgi:hypothetical protein